MQDGIGFTQSRIDPIDVVADEIFHAAVEMARRRSQRQPGNRPDVLFELRDHAGGLGPMTGIVNPWGQIFDQQASVFEHEELDPDDADIIEIAQHRFGGIAGRSTVDSVAPQGTVDHLRIPS